MKERNNRRKLYIGKNHESMMKKNEQDKEYNSKIIMMVMVV